MTTNSSIKWRPMWKIWIPIVLFAVPLILEREMLGTTFTPYIYGIIILIYGLVYYFRIRMWQTVVVMGMMSIAIWWYFLAERPGMTFDTFALIGLEASPDLSLWIRTYLTTPAWFVVLILNFVIFYTLGPKLTKAIELEKNAIRIFKISARTIHDERNGFTERPFKVGKHPFEKNDLYGLSAYLESKKVCIASFPGNGVKYTFSMGASPLLKRRQSELSHVFFGSNGDLTVFISKHDYKQYRKQYTFDQLCKMLGETFLRFADYHKSNNEKRILNELKSI
jgi:hypothetical protein